MPYLFRVGAKSPERVEISPREITEAAKEAACHDPWFVTAITILDRAEAPE